MRPWNISVGRRCARLPFNDIAARHRDVIAALSHDGVAPAAFAGEDGLVLATVLEEVVAGPDIDLRLAASDYPELFQAVIADRVVRRPPTPGARVRIFGLLEARLQNVDVLVMGGLTEGTWPPDARTDAWLSRPMRHQLGLDLPERRIGLTAHDFAQALGAPDVVLARAAKVGGAPTLWSRFVQRLAAVAGEAHWKAAKDRGWRYLRLAQKLDGPEKVVSIKAPTPKPPLEARPSGLSVTEIEHWLRDPYTIYAKHVLKLAPLDAVDTPPGYADRGTVIHASVGDFASRYAKALPADPVDELLAIGEKHFAPLKDYPEASAFWWPRFVRIAHWFAGWESARRGDTAAIHAEVRGTLPIPLGDRTFTLRGVADRIERRADGSYVILDYKTGQARTEKQVRSGLAPQLTLEAAILRGGGFPGIPAGASVSGLAYVLLKGGEPAGRDCAIDFKEGTCGQPGRYGTAPSHVHCDAVRRRSDPLPLAGPPDVDHPLRRLRPPGARQGMVAHRRRGRGRDGGTRRRWHRPARAARGAAAMTAVRTIPRAVVERQIAASDPRVSCWVTANAGAGKTHVLAQRVIRLLLDGCEPGRILCLTFTKAAAANMAARVFDRLATWIALDDTALDKALADIGISTVDTARRAHARRLFAAALETPGGLKVQTIHAFCTRLLHQFPFEANVAARFTVLEERAEAELIDSLRLQVLLEAAAAPHGRLGRALAVAITAAADQTFYDMIRLAIAERDSVMAWIDHAGASTRPLPILRIRSASIRRRRWNRSMTRSLRGRYCHRHDGPRSRLSVARDPPAIVTTQHACRLRQAPAVAPASMHICRCSAPATWSRARRSSRPVDPKHPDLAERLSDEQSRLVALLDRRHAVAARDRTAALITIAAEVIGPLPCREGTARPARLRRPDRPDARDARQRVSRRGCTTSSTSASITC